MSVSRTSRAPGKLVLLGEYAVVDGAPALVAAVDRFVTVALENVPTADWCRLRAPQLSDQAWSFSLTPNGVNWTEPADGRTALVAAALTVALEDGLLQADQKVDLSVANPAFFHGDQKLGIGSSAAVTVALARLLLPMDSPTAAVHQLAERIHHRFQGGRGSGIDIAASAWGGVICFQRRNSDSPAIRPVSWPTSLQWLALWTGSSASTRGFLNQVRQLKQTDSERYNACFDRLRALAESGIEQLCDTTVDAFCDTVNRYHDAMAALGDAANIDIVSEPHRALSALSRQHGAAYKPSGAGGGDIGLAFGSAATIRNLAAAADQHGYRPLQMGFAPPPATL